MKKEFKQKWIVALRSDKYKQGQGCLFSSTYNTYCCLGVLRDVVEPGSLDGPWGSDQVTSMLLPEHAVGLTKEQCNQLAKLNDSGSNFKEIAEYIETNIPGEEIATCI